MDGQKRDAWLDALRGAAILLVLGRHLDLAAPGGGMHPLLSCWQRGGWVGVDLFFVLSGFLVSGLLFREYQRQGALDVPRFLLRRALRIYPAFYVLLLATWLAFRYFRLPHTSGSALLAEVFFVQNYFGGMWSHTWSLAVEEHFYLGLPVVLLGLAQLRRDQRDPFQLLVPLGGLVMVAVVVLRCVNAASVPYGHRSHLFPTHLRLDSLLAGVLLAFTYHFHRTWFDCFVARRRGTLLVAGAACFVPAFLFELEATWLLSTFGLTLFAGGAVLLIAAGLGSPASLPVRMLAPVGGSSYSIYLWHVPMLVWGPALAEYVLGTRLEGATRMAVYLAGSLLLGVVMAWAVERPALRLRDRWLGTHINRRRDLAAGPDVIRGPVAQQGFSLSSGRRCGYHKKTNADGEIRSSRVGDC